MIEVPEGPGGLDLTTALATLADRGLTRILCEGGGTLAAGLIGAGLVDDLAVFNGAVLIGAEGQPALGLLGLQSLADAPRPRLVEVQTLGADHFALWSMASAARSG